MLKCIVKYVPPHWSESLRTIPQGFIKLANKCTPIEEWNLPGLPNTFKLWIKRDDMSGCTTSGNKVRKLEFIMAEVMRSGSKHVLTCGAAQSNHCRTVAVLCAQLGFTSHLFLRTDCQQPEEVPVEGNMFLNSLCGAHMYIVPKRSPYLSHVKPRMESLARSIEKMNGERSYLIPVGGSDHVGVWGYIEAFREIVSEGFEFDDLVFVCGSGGTAAGLSIANFLCGSPVRCHGIAVCDSSAYFYGHITEMLAALGLEDRVTAQQLLTVYEDYRGQGYGKSTDKEIDFIANAARSTGIVLDPVYTGKAALGLCDLLKTRPSLFKGQRILFLHSGGAFGLLPSDISSRVLRSAENRSLLRMAEPV